MPYTAAQTGFKATDTETSQQAAQSAAHAAPSLRVKVLEAIRGAHHGLTADEAAEKLNLSILAIRPRVTELKSAGLIVPSCARRKNASGRSAVVWVSRGES